MLFQGYYQVAGTAKHGIQNYITMCLKNIDQFEAENHPTWGEDKFIRYTLDLIRTILCIQISNTVMFGQKYLRNFITSNYR